MKKFILRSAALFGVACAITLGVFAAVSVYRTSPDLMPDTQSETVNDQPTNDTASTSEALSDEVPEAGIPLASFALTAEQKSKLKAIGINADTFVLTKAMISCAEAKIGVKRVQAIKNHAQPTTLEIAKVSPCLTAS